VRILHIIPSISPARGGTSRAIIDMVHALQSHQLDVEIATTNDDGDNLLDVPLQECIQYHQIPTYFFPRFSPPIGSIREFAFSRSFTTWLLQHIENYDAIHVHTLFSYTSTVAMAIARIKKIPYLTTPHGMLCKWSLQQKTRKKQAYLKLIERSNLDRSQAIHLTCQQEQQDVLALNFKSPTFVLPLALTEIPAPISNAANLLRQNLNCPLDEPIILFLSRLHYKKGLDYLIPALGKLIHHRFTFVIAGNGTPEYEAEIHSLLQVSGIAERTHMVGFVEGAQKDLFIQGSNLFALTSHSENFGIAVLEALVVGTPVLVTPGVGLASVVKDQNIGYVPELDLNAIINALERHLTDPDSSKVMGDRARQFILKNYTWDQIATDLIRVYQAIVDRQPIPSFTDSESPILFN
jgi:glycosyltransferase involved in cell wall biosynthesis